jgi:hypothetical protein
VKGLGNRPSFPIFVAVKSHRGILIVFLLGLAPLLAGCGRKNEVVRFPVHGTVVLADGAKLSGSISFLPAKGQSGPAATTALTDGSYKFDRSNGPAAGPHTVIVKRIVPRPRVPDPLTVKRPIQKAGMEWTRTAEVADDGRYLHDFTLED